MTLRLRPATPDDVTEIHALVHELAAYERQPDDCTATPDALREALFGPRPAAECVMAEWDGAVVGFAVFCHNFSTWLARRGLYLEDLFVRPAWRGRGIGKALLAHLAQVAVQRGCGRFEWSVLDWNTPAIDFYRAQGAVGMDGWTVHRLEGAALRTLADTASATSLEGA